MFASSGLNHPGGIAFDGNGDLYAANWGTSSVEEFLTGKDLGVFASSHLNHPAGLAFDSSGNLYAANYWGTTLEEFSSAGADFGTFASDLNAPDGLTFDSSGNLYVVNQNTNTIVKFGSNGANSVFASSGMNEPDFIAVQTPEPGSIALLLAGAVAFATWRQRRSPDVTALRQRQHGGRRGRCILVAAPAPEFQGEEFQGRMTNCRGDQISLDSICLRVHATHGACRLYATACRTDSELECGGTRAFRLFTCGRPAR